MILNANFVFLVLMKAFVKVGGKKYFDPVELVVVKEMDNMKYWPGCREIGILETAGKM